MSPMLPRQTSNPVTQDPVPIIAQTGTWISNTNTADTTQHFIDSSPLLAVTYSAEHQWSIFLPEARPGSNSP
jgi:hypothetical protein